jgi:hypothetical protein
MEASADSDNAAVADANSAASNGPEVQILTDQTLNKTAEKHPQQQ